MSRAAANRLVQQRTASFGEVAPVDCADHLADHESRLTMRAAIFNGPGDITVAGIPDPTIAAPTDAIVRVVLACVCGSDLWYWRGLTQHVNNGIGHEFVGVVEAIGSAVTSIREGD